MGLIDWTESACKIISTKKLSPFKTMSLTFQQGLCSTEREKKSMMDEEGGQQKN